MADVLKLITYIIVNHGYWAAFAFVSVSSIPLLAGAYLLSSKNVLSKIIDRKFSEKEEEEKANHKHGNRLRKQFAEEVQEILSDLAEETKANRAIIFEFSNGTTNLVGLPFLFMTATNEVATPGLPLMSQRHERLNTAMVAPFLTRLERDGFIFVDRTGPIPPDCRVLEQVMERADIESVLFYSIQGVDEAIGFLAIVTTRSSYNILEYPAILPLVSRAAQRIGSMINYDEIDEREKEKKKFKWWWQM